jgi:hypothetical protein
MARLCGVAHVIERAQQNLIPTKKVSPPRIAATRGRQAMNVRFSRRGGSTVQGESASSFTTSVWYAIPRSSHDFTERRWYFNCNRPHVHRTLQPRVMPT